MIKLTRKGIIFRYHMDDILYRWPWKRSENKEPYYSREFSLNFSFMREYWTHSGAVSEHVRSNGSISGNSLEEVILQWATSKYPFTTMVVLWDIDYEAKPREFWETLPSTKLKAISQDVSVFHCSRLREALKIYDSIIADNLGKSLLIHKGDLYDFNKI